MGIPVTQPEVVSAFAATDGPIPLSPAVTAARAALATELTPLFNRHMDGGGGGGGGGTWPGSILHTQSAPSTTWGPLTHTFSHRAKVAIYNTAGTKVYAKITEATLGQVIISFNNPQTGSAVLSP